MREPPYPVALKPYGQALVELARRRPEVVCLSGDLTRQCEVDLFQAEFPDRFIQCGMAEANMLGVAGALARCGHLPFVHTFGVFATRRPLDQIISAIGYPRLPVRIIGFMPGISSPGGPSHQAIDDVALMRAVPGMTVLDVADAVEARQVCAAIADLPGPVYVRLKRGEVPVIFDDSHVLSLDQAQVLRRGGDVALFASGMMLAPALAAATVLGHRGVAVSVVNVPVLKPLDTSTVLAVAEAARVVLTAENHLVSGGLGTAVAETLATAGLGRPVRRIGLRDTFAEGARGADYLLRRYGLSAQSIVTTAWQALGRPGRPRKSGWPPPTPASTRRSDVHPARSTPRKRRATDDRLLLSVGPAHPGRLTRRGARRGLGTAGRFQPAARRPDRQGAGRAGPVRAGRADLVRHEQHPLHDRDTHRELGPGQVLPLRAGHARPRADPVGHRLIGPHPPALRPLVRPRQLAGRHLQLARVLSRHM